MAREIIDIGTTANDGTGDPLRDAFNKTNNNFVELYDVGGWGYYRDGESTPATQVFGASPSQLLIDGLATQTNEDFLPREIRGSSSLWDVNTNQIKPIALGDSYNVRIDLEIITTNSNPPRFNIVLDIGSTQNGTGAGGSILIIEDSRTIKTGVPQSHTISFPIYSLNTFFTNGGSLWISADSGDITVQKRAITLVRTSRGQI
jgi:hypothetical protein